MPRNALFGRVAIAAALCAGSAAQAAGFDGDTIHAYYIFPTDGAVYNDLGTFVAPGGGASSLAVSYDISGNTITVSTPEGVSWDPALFNGLEFVDVSRDPHIIGISLDPATTASAVSISDASFTRDSVSLNFDNQFWPPTTSAVFDVTFEPVPEPSTWAMMLAGFAGLGFAAARLRREVRIGAR